MSELLRRLWPFPGGLRLDARKAMSTREPIAPAPIPPQLVIPLKQHIGQTPEPLVKVGERVLTGQLLARAESDLSAPLHAPSSGTVIAIEEREVPHPSGLAATCVVIATDGLDEWTALPPPVEDFTGLQPETIRRRIAAAGIVGLGGAAFPTAVKLEAGPDAEIDTLILNAAECEPYISCDDMLMREHSERVIDGLRIIRHALNARHCLIGLEDNKPEAHAALSRALADSGETGIEIVRIPTRYPAGGEKQLIQVLTGKEVPAGSLPMEIGIICHNVGTAAAVYQAVIEGRPLISRIVTVTGAGVAQPRNLEVRLGTPMSALIEACGGYTADADRLLMGGPMMGFSLHTDQLPVVKATNCILAGSAAELPRPAEAMPCIRCGACMEVCPVSLLPQQLYWFARAREFDKAQDYQLFDCIECGACAYACPSHIPLVQYFRFAKSEIRFAEGEREKANLARERHEFRQLRLEREKQEAAEKRRRKKEALGKPLETDDAEAKKKAAIAAALARAKQKKAAQGSVPAVQSTESEQQS